MSRRFATCALLATAATGTPDMPRLTFEMDSPRPGSQLKSPSSVGLSVKLLQGGLSDEALAHLLQYQVCYAGGARAICTLIGGGANNVSQ